MIAVSAERRARFLGMSGAYFMLIYKIVPRDIWREAQAKGVFEGAGVDLEDGYIHFSSRAQVEETAARHFKGAADLLLVAIEADRLGEALKWEPSRGGDLFPHLYGPLPLSAASRVDPLPLRVDGGHEFAGLLA